jgi:hypothetical protein
VVSCLGYSSTLKMEVTDSSGTSVDFQRTTQRYIPEDNILHSLLCLQESATGPHYKPNESILHPPYLFWTRFNVILSTSRSIKWSPCEFGIRPLHS